MRPASDSIIGLTTAEVEERIAAGEVRPRQIALVPIDPRHPAFEHPHPVSQRHHQRPPGGDSGFPVISATPCSGSS